MDRNLLRDVLLSQDKTTQEDIVARTLMEEIEDLRDTPFIVIVSGIRRCGKSTLLQAIKTEQNYYVNFDDERFIDFSVKDFTLLYNLLIELFGGKNVFLFDEIQNVASWERFVRRLHDEKKKVYITGSSATMLSRELGTHLTGRNISLFLYPFSFKEFLAFKRHTLKDLRRLTSSEKSILKKFFSEYLEKGGFPEYLHTEKTEYLQSLYQNILYRDIIVRYNLPSEKPIKETVYYAASNIGKEISFNSVRKLTGLSSATTVKEYFEYLENSFLLFLVPRYDYSAKKQIYYNKKVYFIDPALARIVGFRPTEDYGRLLENIVYLALKRVGGEIFFHREARECDFLVRIGGEVKAVIQVTADYEKSRERETEGLLEAMERHHLRQGLILTDDHSEVIEKNGKTVTIKPVWEWLLEND
jgi:predicted AAA+ superfamily ATPase